METLKNEKIVTERAVNKKLLFEEKDYIETLRKRMRHNHW